MTDRELKKLTRADLLEMLIVKCRENEQLRAELDALKSQSTGQSAQEKSPNEPVSTLMQVLKQVAEQYLQNAAEDAPV